MLETILFWLCCIWLLDCLALLGLATYNAHCTNRKRRETLLRVSDVLLWVLNGSAILMVAVAMFILF